MKIIFKYATLAVSGLALVACSSGTPSKRTVTISDAEQAKRVFSVGNGDAGDVIQDGGTLSARQATTSRVELDYRDNTSKILAVSDDTTFDLRQNASGELTMIIDGVEHAFAPGDRVVESDGSVYGYSVENRDDDIFYSLWSQTGQIDDIKTNGQGYAEVFGYQSNITSEDGALNDAGFVVVGTETRDEDLADLASATYSGRARINVRPATDFQSNSESRDRLRGDLSMSVDFAEGTISGEVGNLTYQEAGSSDRNPEAGKIILNETTFTSNGFAGNVTAEGSTEDGVNGLQAAYSGAFYGNEAQEVGGVIAGAQTINGEDITTSGYFHGDKD